MLNFFKHSKFFLILSVLLILSSFASIFFKGFNYGIDFTGGTLIQISNQTQKISFEQIENLKQKFIDNKKKITIQTFIDDSQKILLKIGDSGSQNEKGINNLENDLFKKIINESFLEQEIIFEKIEFIGAKTGEGFFLKAILAVLLAFLGIFVYLSFRFNFKFTISGILALLHDIIISFGFISFFQIEFNLIFIMAILTIIGYSINDSVIIFDRIRELLKIKSNNLEKDEKKLVSYKDIVNLGLNNTLKRTIFTSVTTLLACFSLIVFGGESLNSFSIPVFFGILIGTYSSIMIACQILFLFNKNTIS